MVSTEENLQRYRQLIEISRDLASTLDLDTLLRRIIQMAADLSNCEAASILLFDERKQQLRFQAATNENSEKMILGIIVPTDSLAGWVAIHREPVIVADVHQDKRWFTNVEEKTKFATHSIIAIPMIAKNKLVGVLEALNKRVGTFTEQDQEYLLVLGAQAAVAIENTRLFQQSDLIAELVHELRTPLASINTVSYLLQRPEVSEEQCKKLAQTIHQETQRLNEMASNFLDLARLESGRSSFQLSEFAIVDLLNECRSVIQARADENHIAIAINVHEDLPKLEADRDKIKQVILNLLSNAVKYNRPEGSIFINTRTDENQTMHISVQDTGFGISEEDLAHMFERFFRARSTEKSASGTGLGLSICKRIIEGHNGRIEVQSKLNEGTTFIIHLPLRPFA